MADELWCLIRGLGRESGHWGDFIDAFQREVGPALPLDLPGSGLRLGERCPSTISGIVDKLRETAAAPPLRLLGLSLGAMVALDWASRFPAEVEAVAVINTSVATLAAPWERFRGEALGRGLGVLISPGAEQREKKILAMTANDPARRAAALPRWVEIARARPVTAATLMRQMTAAALFRPALSRISARGLVLASRGDRMVDYRCSERLAARLDWPLRLHDQAGHDLPLDDPRWLADQVAQWR